MADLEGLKELRGMIGQGLGGLSADETLWRRIQKRAEAPKKPAILRPGVWIPAVAAAAAVLLLLWLPGSPVYWGGGTHYTAGEDRGQLLAAQPVSVSIQNVQESSEKNLLLVGDRVYILTGIPVSEDLLGKSMGTVTEYTRQPSLSGAELASSVVAAGETVYQVKDVSGLAAAKVDGGLYSFQRVSALGRGIGDETLSELLCDPMQVESIDWNGKSLRGNPARQAMQTLCRQGERLNEKLSGGEEICIRLKNGLSLYLLAQNDCAAACGTWYCPEFFEAFR